MNRSQETYNEESNTCQICKGNGWDFSPPYEANGKQCQCSVSQDKCEAWKKIVPFDILNSTFSKTDHLSYLKDLWDDQKIQPFKVIYGPRDNILPVLKQLSLNLKKLIVYTTDQELALIYKMDLDRGDADESPQHAARSRLDKASILVITLTSTKEKQARGQVLEWGNHRLTENKPCWIVAYNEKFSIEEIPAFRQVNLGQVKSIPKPKVESPETTKTEFKSKIEKKLLATKTFEVTGSEFQSKKQFPAKPGGFCSICRKKFIQGDNFVFSSPKGGKPCCPTCSP